MFYVDSDCLRSFWIAKEKFEDDVKFASFDLSANDWPGEPLFLREFPRMVIFFDGKVVGNVRAEGSVDELVAQIKLHLVDK
jgi:hypothetical protein